jgi:outer membrane biogenesis lipoprotein LolB
MTIGSWLIVLITIIGLQGCAGILRGPEDDPRVREVVMDLGGQNPELTHFKGLLDIRLEAGGQTMAGRAACAVAAPDRLRIEWLSMLGQPILSLAADGETITLVSYAERQYRRLPQSRSSLQQLIRFPVAVEDLVTLLRGRPLLPAFFAARHQPGAPQSRLIALVDRWSNTLATIAVDDQNQLQRQELFTPQGQPRYQIEWRQWQTVDHVTLPRRVVLSAPSGERLTISQVRFWPEASFESSMFFLDRPEFIDQ